MNVGVCVSLGADGILGIWEDEAEKAAKTEKVLFSFIHLFIQ